MSDKMVDQWAKVFYADDGDALFDEMKARFIKQNELVRLEDLAIVDSWLEAEDRPTRNLSSILTRKRQLEDLHLLLKRSGR